VRKTGLGKKTEAPDKIAEARLRAQGIQARIEAEEWSRQRAFGISFFEFFDCFIPFDRSMSAAAPPIALFDSGVATGFILVTGFIKSYPFLFFEPALRMGREEETTYTGSTQQTIPRL
jgi:hypothetical protein